jgi:hypothetical protein
MERRSDLSQIPRKPLAGRNAQFNSHAELHLRFKATAERRYADSRTQILTNHVNNTSKPALQSKLLPPPPSTSGSLANPETRILRPFSTRSSNHIHASERIQKPRRAPVPRLCDRDFLSSQRLRRTGNMLPSVWTHQFTKDGLERADSGVAMGPRQKAMSEPENSLKPAQPNRGFSFGVGPEVVSLGARKAVAEICDGKVETVGKGKDGNRVKENGPPRTFDDILKGMGRARRVPAALRE